MKLGLKSNNGGNQRSEGIENSLGTLKNKDNGKLNWENEGTEKNTDPNGSRTLLTEKGDNEKIIRSKDGDSLGKNGKDNSKRTENNEPDVELWITEKYIM